MYVSVCYLEREINRQIGRNYARECSLMREIGDRKFVSDCRERERRFTEKESKKQSIVKEREKVILKKKVL